MTSADCNCESHHMNEENHAHTQDPPLPAEPRSRGLPPARSNTSYDLVRAAPVKPETVAAGPIRGNKPGGKMKNTVTFCIPASSRLPAPCPKTSGTEATCEPSGTCGTKDSFSVKSQSSFSSNSTASFCDLFREGEGSRTFSQQALPDLCEMMSTMDAKPYAGTMRKLRKDRPSRVQQMAERGLKVSAHLPTRRNGNKGSSQHLSLSCDSRQLKKVSRSQSFARRKHE